MEQGLFFFIFQGVLLALILERAHLLVVSVEFRLPASIVDLLILLLLVEFFFTLHELLFVLVYLHAFNPFLLLKLVHDQ